MFKKTIEASAKLIYQTRTVIPAKAGIHILQHVKADKDSGFRQNDCIFHPFAEASIEGACDQLVRPHGRRPFAVSISGV